MRVYSTRRLLRVPLMLMAITVVAFAALRFPPVSNVVLMIEVYPQPDETLVARVEHMLGRDQSVWLHYARWLGVARQEDGGFSGILEGDLGRSVWAEEQKQ